MKKSLIYYGLAVLLIIWSSPGFAQKHLANGESVIRGNRLISVKSDNGKQLYQPGRIFVEQQIQPDGRMSEAAWEHTPVITPFSGSAGKMDQTSVRVLYDRENIYLFWNVEQPDGLTSRMTEPDEVITGDDYIQVDLKPWLPDSIIHGRDYYYSIAVNPDGVVWDAYLDPYLDGFYFGSWDSQARVETTRETNRWQAEMVIPYAGLDVYSNPGWKWNLEFHHASQDGDTATITSSNVGLTVQQDVMVRQAGLVSYYWPRPDFMQEVKPDMSAVREESAVAMHLAQLPGMNRQADESLWSGARRMPIAHSDKMGEALSSNTASARIGMTDRTMVFDLRGDGATIKEGAGTGTELGAGMAGQMAGVNGVFVDPALFANECFWIVLQPRSTSADNIHQDYYMIIVNNRGEVTGTHYDKYGAPFRTWQPQADVDLFNTATGWGAELVLDLSSLDIPIDAGDAWGVNVFRNRLLEDGSELQAWRYTGNDFLNPARFGTLKNVRTLDPAVIRATMERKAAEFQARLQGYQAGHRSLVRRLNRELGSLRFESPGDLRESGKIIASIDQTLGTLDAVAEYQSVPHPAEDGFPLMDVQFIGEHGWAVGAMGTILRTEDGGTAWQRVPLDSDADLYRVDFVNAQEGWAAGGRIRNADTNESMRHDKRGGYAYIYHTTDGGKTWECQFGERGRHLFGLDFVNEDLGYACGERGYLLKTTDGGEHWNVLPTTGTMNWLYGMTFPDENTGFAVGLNETVIRTTDGGKTWTTLDGTADTRMYGFSPIYRDVSFNGNTGCIVGQNGAVLISHDLGATWAPAATYYKDEIRELMDLRSVQFVSPQRGYAVGELGSKILMTDDGGRNWVYRSTGGTEWLRAIWAEPSGRLIATGEREKIIASRDQGLNWNQLHGEPDKIDILVMMAHGDDAAINLNSFFANYTINENKKIVDVGTLSDVHSSEYEETYNLEHDRNVWMIGVGTSSNFNEFETGNNGANYYHFNQRLWEGEHNVVRHMVAAIRAYRPDIVITHGGVFGDYDKPGHKLSGRAGLVAFETAGGDRDQWPELTRLGLAPWQPKKLYHLASQSYPATLDLAPLGQKPLQGTNMTCKEFGEYVIKNYQSQGVYHTRDGKLCLVKSLVPVPARETSVFDGLE